MTFFVGGENDRLLGIFDMSGKIWNVVLLDTGDTSIRKNGTNMNLRL